MVHCVQDELGQMPAQVMEPACCAEFLVTRERVLRRPLAFYQNALKVIQVSLPPASVQ